MTSIDAQSDASAMSAQRYAMKYVAKALQTMQYPGRSKGDATHSMVFIIIDDVVKTCKTQGGRTSLPYKGSSTKNDSPSTRQNNGKMHLRICQQSSTVPKGTSSRV